VSENETAPSTGQTRPAVDTGGTVVVVVGAAVVVVVGAAVVVVVSSPDGAVVVVEEWRSRRRGGRGDRGGRRDGRRGRRCRRGRGCGRRGLRWCGRRGGGRDRRRGRGRFALSAGLFLPLPGGFAFLASPLLLGDPLALRLLALPRVLHLPVLGVRRVEVGEQGGGESFDLDDEFALAGEGGVEFRHLGPVLRLDGHPLVDDPPVVVARYREVGAAHGDVDERVGSEHGRHGAVGPGGHVLLAHDVLRFGAQRRETLFGLRDGGRETVEALPDLDLLGHRRLVSCVGGFEVCGQFGVSLPGGGEILLCDLGVLCCESGRGETEE